MVADSLTLSARAKQHQGVLLESRELDLAVVYDLKPPTGALADELELTYFFDDRYAAAIPQRHRLAGEQVIELSALADDVWINPTARDLCHELILGACRGAGFEPNVAFEGDEIATSLALIARGSAVTLLPSLAVGIGSRRPDVVFASLGALHPCAAIYAARLSTRYQTPASEAMLAVLGEVGREASPPPARAA